MKNYTEVIEYIEAALNGNCVDIYELQSAKIYDVHKAGKEAPEPIAYVTLTVEVPLRCIPNE